VQFRAALVYNHFGDTDRTLQSLEKTIGAGLPPSLMNQTPDFEHLRADPRFALKRGLVPRPSPILIDQIALHPGLL
jgi:hypothetical protein